MSSDLTWYQDIVKYSQAIRRNRIQKFRKHKKAQIFSKLKKDFAVEEKPWIREQNALSVACYEKSL